MKDDELAPEERRLFDALPRESRPADGAEDALVARLRADGHFRRRWRRHLIAAAAAAAIFVGGAAAGAWFTERRSLEGQLTRPSLTAQEADALVERTRSAYQRARDRYTVITGAEPAGVEPVRVAGVIWF